MNALEVLDWRRRVFAMYAEVRATADHAAGHRLWRQTRDQLFATHPASPLLPDDRASFSGLPVPPYDPDWRFEIEMEEQATTRMEVDAGSDGVVPFERLGVVNIPDVGALDVWRLASYGGGLFVPVKDVSAGTGDDGTYGGGRYLIDTVKGADLGTRNRSVVLDFNFAYNPSCAYNPAWACPLAPRGNAVPVTIPVGERR